MGYGIDGLQCANWSKSTFRQMRTGGVDAVCVTIAYHEVAGIMDDTRHRFFKASSGPA